MNRLSLELIIGILVFLIGVQIVTNTTKTKYELRITEARIEDLKSYKNELNKVMNTINN